MAAVLVAVVFVACAYVWRAGPAGDDAILLQLAILPIAAVIAAPYALIYELTAWLGSFWLLLRYTRHRPRAQHAPAVADQRRADRRQSRGRPSRSTFGADGAALLGLCGVGFIVWLFHAHVVDPNGDVQRQSALHIPTE